MSIITKVTHYFKDDSKEKKLTRLNFLFYFLIIFIFSYVSLFLYSFGEDLKKCKESEENSIKEIVTIPYIRIIPGVTNYNNTSNLNSIPVLKINEMKYTNEKAYSEGDIILIKYFNVYGIVLKKSVSFDDYYIILYKDINHQLNTISLPTFLLLKPTNSSINPFVFIQ